MSITNGTAYSLKNKANQSLIWTLCLILNIVLCTGCYAQPDIVVNQAPMAVAESKVIDQSQVLYAQRNQMRDIEVIFSAPVKKLLRDDTNGIPHQQFLLELENGTTVKVAHNTNEAPRVPINPGDIVTICGEYIWNEKGGVVHWTHHTDGRSRHPSGYIKFNEQIYD